MSSQIKKGNFIYSSTSKRVISSFFARSCLSYAKPTLNLPISLSAGQTGPVTPWLEDPNAPQRKDAATLGQALFDAHSFEDWSNLYQINAFSVFFSTTAFLGLLAKGSEDVPGWTSSVVNITSVSGLMKLSQNHVRPPRSNTPPTPARL